MLIFNEWLVVVMRELKNCDLHDFRSDSIRESNGLSSKYKKMKIPYRLAKILGCLLVGQWLAVNVLAAELIIDDGVVIKFGPGAQLVVRDKLQVGQGVVMTSHKDDKAIGPISSVSQTASAGDWSGVRVEKSATGFSATDTTIRYAGAQEGAALAIRGNNPSAQYLTLSDSLIGLALEDGASPTLTGASILRNSIGVNANGSASAKITGSQIVGNTAMGALNQTPATALTATGNWWGHATGPKDAVANQKGLGDGVSTGVVYSDYLAAAPLLNPKISLANQAAYFESRSIDFNISCLNATEYRIAEGSAFTGVSFQPLENGAARVNYMVSEGDGLKNISVQFRNAAGVVATASLGDILRIDSVGPQIALTNPANGSQVTRSIAIETNATDPAGIKKVEFWIDGILVGTSTSSPYVYPWSVASLVNGQHEIKVVAYDIFGHVSQAESSVLLNKLVSSYSQVIPATSNIFGAGHSVAPSGGGSGGDLPNVANFQAKAGQVLTFSDVSGQVTCWVESGVFVAADGGACGDGGTNVSAYGGISGIKHSSKNMFLAGVFLESEELTGVPQETLDFSSNTDFASLAPKIGQIFYIGDGLTGMGSGETQKFYVPPTATRLFLGFADGYNFTPCCYGDNQGALTANFDITRPADADISGPAISDIKFNGVNWVDGITLSRSGALTLTALDAAGVARIEVLIDDKLMSSISGTTSFTANINLDQLANGTHIITLRAFDSLGNVSTASYTITVAHAAPDAPVLTGPADGLLTRVSAQTMTGTAKAGVQVRGYLNGAALADLVTVGSDGRFTIPVTLTSGANQIQAKAIDQYGESALSVARTVTLDLSVPQAPTNLAVQSQASGKIKLGWTRSSDASTAGYDIYRANAAFTLIGEAVKINGGMLTTTSYEDTPTVDGNYFYRVVARNQLGTLSEPSNQVQVVVDATPPKAVSIVYAPQGKVDAASGRVGQGKVNVTLNVSEALGFAPYLAIVPQGGQPIPLELLKVSDTQYTGSVTIDAGTLSGEAQALFSARDVVGNRGTQIDAGATLLIDTAGPDLINIALSPTAPIKNDTAQTIVATLTASKVIKSTESPVLTAQLSGPLRTPIAATSVTRVNSSTWQASFTLPADAGLAAPEYLSLTWRALDDLDNVSTKVTAANRFQVYQGNLPPLDAPLNFTAKAVPGGKVSLAWQAVAEAQGYQIYRQAPGESALTAYVRVSTISHLDQTVADGRYKYAVATIRKAGDQESLSAQTNALEVQASSTAPGAPQNLSLQVTGQGILATWQAPLASEVASYNLYRGPGLTLDSIAGLAPIKTNIKQTLAIDASPSLTDHAYVVTALDAVGNESVLSNSAYLNASLLPVSTLKVEQLGKDLPVVSWTASRTSVAGYNVYLGADAARQKMTTGPISALSYTDSGFTAGERRYTVAATDSNGIEMPRSILMPNLSMQIASGLPLKRGLMNRLQVQVSNTSAQAVDNARVAIELAGKTHRSAAFSLAANETRLVPVVVGGYTTLGASEQARVAVEITPNEGELVRIARDSSVDVIEGALQVSLATEAFTRGATGKVRVTVENTSDVEVEVLTARNNAADASNELRFKLLDADNNVLATHAFKQGAGANVITLANGLTVARIAAGASFISDAFEVDVPAGSPDKIRVKLEMDKIRFHSGQDDEVQITGKSPETTVSLLDTAYYGEVTSVDPVSSFGDKDVTITGQAIDRNTKQVLANSKLKLILNQQGFERVYQVVTDAAGAFSYVFKPTLTDVGLYKVSAVHPDITDRPEQKSFTINRVAVGPTTYNLTVPRNYTYTVPLQGVSGVGTSAANLRLALEADAQPSGQIPAGIALTLPNPVTLTQRQTLAMPLIFTADNSAVSPGSVVLRAYADESPTKPLGQVTLNYTLTEAKPYLTATPSYVETGMAIGGSEVETVVVGNTGQQDALDLQFVLLNEDDSAAPDWVRIASLANGTLAVGEKRSIDLSFTPSTAVPEGVYRFKLRVTGSNVSTQTMNVFASVTQSGKGNVMFKAADIYTATQDAQGRLIPGLAGARIVVQNEDVATVTQELVTDNLGEAMFQELPSGRYKYKATAGNHQETTGRFAIKPGVTLSQPIFLDYNLVTVDWSVKEVTLEDRYDIVLNTTYETNVPAPVVVLAPASVNLPKLKTGEVFYGELTLTNYGLVRADNVQSKLPASNAFFKYDFLVDLPTSLAAKSRLTIPYRITTLKSLEEDGAATGGGCWSHIDDFGVDYKWKCANGDERCGTTRSYWVSVSASSCSAGGGGQPLPWPTLYYGSEVLSSRNGGNWVGRDGVSTELPNAPLCAACKTGKCCTPGGGAAK